MYAMTTSTGEENTPSARKLSVVSVAADGGEDDEEHERAQADVRASASAAGIAIGSGALDRASAQACVDHEQHDEAEHDQQIGTSK